IHQTNATQVRPNQLHKSGKIDEAIALSTELVKKQPGNPNHYLTLINDHPKAGDPYTAMTYAERGLNQFSGNSQLVNKKSGRLADQKRYDELLPFLQEQMKYGNRGVLQEQYN